MVGGPYHIPKFAVTGAWSEEIWPAVSASLANALWEERHPRVPVVSGADPAAERAGEAPNPRR